ncbi:hypothetical protein [Trichocoleus desertorum]|uniref:SMODS and SLOG-associating 2TM effector domain-containing protein n=2 Tax=Trichocoleus TaxID=450526 RepID=A0ABV0JFM3_9CYAN|nr:hypothetical protein [Trichocoleus sp. FACHB-46]
MESNSSDNYKTINVDQGTKANATLIYDYTDSLLKTQRESLNRLDTKMSAFFAFAGALLKFALNLPSGADLLNSPPLVLNTCLVLQVVVCISAAISASVSAIGLTAKLGGEVPSPKILMSNKLYKLDEETLRCKIINSWIRTEKEYLELSAKKRDLLNWSIKILCASTGAFALDIVIASSYMH